jgi:hypothetical protein
MSVEDNIMRQDSVRLVRRFGVTAAAIAASALLAACGGGSAGDPPHQPTAQAITFGSPGNQTLGTAPATLSASASSALAVSLASTTTGVCTVSGTTLTLVAPGTCSLTATQAGNNIYAAAPPVTVSFSVAAAPVAQTITFPSPGAQTVGTAPPALSATASSGLAVSYASNTPSICTVSGTALTLLAGGTCTLVASQPGNATYGAAAAVIDSFQVAGAPAPQTLTFSSGFAGNSLTVEGGSFGGYSGSNEDGYNCSGFCGGGGAFVPAVTADASAFYYYYQTPTAATDEYVGIFLGAPGVTGGPSKTADTPGVQITSQTTIQFDFGMNPEWFTSGTPNVGVLLTMGKHYSVNGNFCNVKLLSVFTPTAQAATTYSIPLSSFVINQNCADTSLTTASVLATMLISQVDFQGDGGGPALSDGTKLTGANLSVPTGSPAVYPTTLVVNGAVTFQ